jgi:hypothetical protein
MKEKRSLDVVVRCRLHEKNLPLSQAMHSNDRKSTKRRPKEERKLKGGAFCFSVSLSNQFFSRVFFLFNFNPPPLSLSRACVRALIFKKMMVMVMVRRAVIFLERL